MFRYWIGCTESHVNSFSLSQCVFCLFAFHFWSTFMFYLLLRPLYCIPLSLIRVFLLLWTTNIVCARCLVSHFIRFKKRRKIHLRKKKTQKKRNIIWVSDRFFLRRSLIYMLSIGQPTEVHTHQTSINFLLLFWLCSAATKLSIFSPHFKQYMCNHFLLERVSSITFTVMYLFGSSKIVPIISNWHFFLRRGVYK